MDIHYCADSGNYQEFASHVGTPYLAVVEKSLWCEINRKIQRMAGQI